MALANVSPQAASIAVVIRNDTGAVLGPGTITLEAGGHTSFVLTDLFSATALKSGTVEFDTPANGQIGVPRPALHPGGPLHHHPGAGEIDLGGGYPDGGTEEPRPRQARDLLM